MFSIEHKLVCMLCISTLAGCSAVSKISHSVAKVAPVPVINCNYEVSSDGLKFYIVKVTFYERLSEELVPPANSVFAVLIYAIQNSSAKTVKAPSEPFKVVTRDGRAYKPDLSLTRSLKISAVTPYLPNARAFGTRFEVAPDNKWHDVYAVYVVPKSADLGSAEVVEPKEISPR